MNPSTIRVGIIGAGVISQEHAVAIRQLGKGVSLTAVADIDLARAKAFALVFDVPDVYASSDELIVKSDVDLIVVATPPAFHEAPVVASLEAGKYVLCEKPLAHTLEVARRICDVAAKFPKRLVVGHQMRFSHEFQRLKWCVANGIGALRSAVIERHGHIPAMHSGSGSWWGKWDIAGGGVLLTQMIHEIDLMIEVFGPARAVKAAVDTRFSGIESEDGFEAEVEFEGGRTAVCRGSVNSGSFGGCFRVVGDKGSVAFPERLTLGNGAAERSVLGRMNRALPRTRSASQSIPARVTRKILRKLGLASKKVPSPHVNFYRGIIAAMRNGDTLPVTPESAMQALEFCMSVYESGITGERVELPLGASSRVFAGVTPALYSARKNKELVAIRPLAREGDVRIGLIGLDTSHAPTFTSLLNNPLTPNYLSGVRVVAGYAGGSPDMEISATRVDAFTRELEYAYGIPMYADPARVAEVSDLVFIIASDGRQHVDLLEKVATAGKPVFVDKPFAISTEDAEKMFAIAAKHDLRLKACSAFRYADGLVNALARIRENSEVVKECEVQIWMPIQETQGRYFWYGIHASEMLVAVMGPGSQKVSAKQDGDTDTIDVEYDDGRRGRIVGCQGDNRYLVKIVTDKKTHQVDLGPSVATLAPRLLWAIIDSLTQGAAPRLWRAGDSGAIPGDRPSRFLDPTSDETREVVSILDLAQKSLAKGSAGAR